jgi:hypothetical protein
VIAHLVPAREGTVDEAVALSERLLSLAESRRAIVSAALTARGPAVLLGRRQHSKTVLDLHACHARSVTVGRRFTTGAHVFIGTSGAAVFSLALPSIDTLVDDARPATVLNRNVRGWLAALTRSTAIAHYFGRDWLSIARRPCGSLALRAARSGAVVIELWLGARESTALPVEFASDRERAIDRWLGRQPASYFECAGTDAMDLRWCDEVQRRTLERYRVNVRPEPAATLDRLALAEAPIDERSMRWAEPQPCAIGWVEAALSAQNTVWIGGDALVSDAALEALGEALTNREQRAERTARIVTNELVLGADAEAWGRCGAALDSVVRSAPR